MMDNLAQIAIDYALKHSWKDAIKTNLEILRDNPNDIDSLNRLAKAYFESGNVILAKRTSLKVLKIDPNDSIAQKSVERFKQVNKPNKNSSNKFEVSSSFIEIPGKTKLTTLINLGSEKVYSYLNPGDEVYFATHAHKISVVTESDKYIGKLTDDLSARLRKFIKSGDKYQIIVKSISKNSVRIFIKSQIACFPLEMSESLGEFSS